MTTHEIEAGPLRGHGHILLPEWAARAVAAYDDQGLCELVIHRCSTEVFDDKRHDARFLQALSDSITENVKALHEVLGGRAPAANTPLSQRLRFAEVEAETRVTQASLQRSYRISFFLQGQAWAEVVSAAAAREDVGRGEAMAALVTLDQLIHAYADAVISNVALNFAQSEDALNRSRAHVRQRLIRELLNGTDEVLSPADMATLDYSLSGWHLAVLLPDTPQGAAGQLLVGLRTAVRPMHSVVYPVQLDSSVLWLGSDARWSEERIGRVVELLETAGVSAAISDPAPLLAGFLKTFEQINQVEDVRRSARDPRLSGVVRHAELRLEILLLQTPDLAGDFVAQELGPLAEDTSDAAKLRATLEASFRLGSHVATADFLQLHEHTVRNRLQKAHELLGPFQERRTELQVALRLWKMLDET